MSLQILKNWPVLDFLGPKITANIRMVMVYGTQSCRALFVTHDQEVYIVGDYSLGHLHCQLTDIALYTVKLEVLCGMNIKTISYGSNHMCVVTEQGELYAWGSNKYGQLGIGSDKDKTLPTLVMERKGLIDIACGNRHTLALMDTGEVYGWGDNGSNQVSSFQCKTLSLPNITYKYSKDNQAIAISCSFSSSFLVTKNGNVYSWGNNEFGQLGLGHTTAQKEPEHVEDFDGSSIVKIACGYGHVLAIDDEGVLFVWGKNDSGQLGLGTTTNKLCPTKLHLPDTEKVLDVAAHFFTNISVAMGERSRVFVWGECLGEEIIEPALTMEVDVCTALARYTLYRVMHQPLILHPENKTSVSNVIKEAFNDPTTSDLTIKVHGTPIHVHKTILQLRCQHFKNMFKEHWAESKESVIENNDFCYNVYEAFLKYLYTDEVHVTVKDSLELYDLANSYCESELKIRCIQLIKEGITVANVLYLHNAASAYELKELKEFCFNFALRHMTEVVQTPFFAEMSKTQIIDFIQQVAANDAFKT